MIIEVTQGHIDAGQSQNCRKCPVALAVQDATGDSSVSAGMLFIYVGARTYYQPSMVGYFIADFDNGRPVKPFTFELPYED